MNAPARHAEFSVGIESVGFSRRDFYAMQARGAFNDMKIELVDGRLERMAPAAGGHAVANISIALKLAKAYGDDIPDIASDLMIEIDDTTVRGCDLVVANRTFAPDRAALGSEIALAIEIAQTTLPRDIGAKAEEYARVAIPVYWVVDLLAKVVHVFSSATANGYQDRAVIRFGEPLDIPGTGTSITIE